MSDDTDGATAPTASSRSLLEQFLGTDISVQSFFDSYLYHKHLVVHHGENENDDDDDESQSILKTILERMPIDLATLLAETPSPNIFVWIGNNSNNNNNNNNNHHHDRLQQVEIPDADTAHALYTYGKASLYFRAPQEFIDYIVPTLCTDLGFPPSLSDGEIEVFFSRAGNVTEWHTDFMENFTIQLRGRKQWQLRTSELKHPVRGCTPHFRNIDTLEQQQKLHSYASSTRVRPFAVSPPVDEFFADEHVDTVTLEPGSCLYFPAGMWHRVKAVEDSLSINISLMPSSWGDLVASAARQLAWKHELFREPIRIVDNNRTAAAAHLQTIITMLTEELATIQAADLLPAPGVENDAAAADDDDDADDRELDDETMEQEMKKVYRVNEMAVLLFEPPASFIVHANFGNEEIRSTTREVVKVMVERDDDDDDDDDDDEQMVLDNDNDEAVAFLHELTKIVPPHLFSPATRAQASVCRRLVAAGFLSPVVVVVETTQKKRKLK